MINGTEIILWVDGLFGQDGLIIYQDKVGKCLGINMKPFDFLIHFRYILCPPLAPLAPVGCISWIRLAESSSGTSRRSSLVT